MVYCGKPSRGCQMCRTRRIKCDETRPTCQQCQKSRRQCPGYKNDFDLVFRNETEATERRARKITSREKTGGGSSSSDLVSGPSSAGDHYVRTDAIVGAAIAFLNGLPSGLSIPVDDQAPCYFLTNFVLSPQKSNAMGFFGFLVPMLKSESPDSHLAVAFRAVAMASLANRPNSRTTYLMYQAIGLYAKALKATNIALQNPQQQLSDQTLAAVLLLGFFETIASEKTNAMAWGSHVDGATQLVKMRGRKQLRTKIGADLFLYVRMQMIINCTAASKLPLLGTDWWVTESLPDEISLRITKLTLEMVELRVEVNDVLSLPTRDAESIQKVRDIMRRLDAWERQYQTWESSLPSFWQPKTVAWVDNHGGDIINSEACPGKVEMYRDLFTAYIWNQARLSRLYVSGIVVRCVARLSFPVDYRTTPEYASAARMGVDMVCDIISSIPFHLGWHVNRRGELVSDDVSESDDGNGFVTNPKALGAFLCMWPLFGSSCSDFITDLQRRWVQGRMEYIGDSLGLNQAKLLMGGYGLRLPSMSVRRDMLYHAPLPIKVPTQAITPAPVPVKKPISKVVTPAAKIPIPVVPGVSSTSVQPRPTPLSVRGQKGTKENGLATQEASQRSWEEERDSLLKKATKSQGESFENTMSKWMAI